VEGRRSLQHMGTSVLLEPSKLRASKDGTIRGGGSVGVSDGRGSEEPKVTTKMGGKQHSHIIQKADNHGKKGRPKKRKNSEQTLQFTS